MNAIELEAIASVAAACKRQGKAFGIHAGTKMMELFIDDVSIAMMRDDSDLLLSGLKDISADFRRLSGEK